MEDRIHEDYNAYYEKMERFRKTVFGDYWKAKMKNNKNEIRALKIINLREMRENIECNLDIDDVEEEFKKCIKEIKNEIQNMIICSNGNKNENSVKYYEHFESENEFIIVMELCDTSLLKLIKQRKEGFTIDEILIIMKQLNNTFKIMRENNIVHRDIKLENILVKYQEVERNDFLVKLSDYDISKKVTDTDKCTEYCGTIISMAPEILKNDQEYDEKCDLWSIGIMLYQLYFKDYPYKGMTEVALLRSIQMKRIKKKTGDENLDNLINGLLKEDPKERITWEEYFNHSFFKTLTKKEINEKLNGF